MLWLGKERNAMSGNRNVILDTNVLINYSKGYFDSSFFDENFDEFNISLVTYMEVKGFPVANIFETHKLNKLINASEIIEIDLSIAEKVIQYKMAGRKKIKLPDAIILATASIYRLALLTEDYDDFKGIDDSVELINLKKIKL